MKGIVLAGGAGSRLHPLTHYISKQLLPVYNKPMIYYPLSTLMLAKITEILVITTPLDLPAFQRLLGDGTQWKLKIQYAVQPEPKGLAEALIIGEDFLKGGPCCLILGDNIIYKDGLQSMLSSARERVKTNGGALIFGYSVSNPSQYGVAEFDTDGKLSGLWEKPAKPPSNQAVIGLYFYDGTATARAKKLQPSARGELEITCLNRSYFADGQLVLERLGRGAAWFDMGTHESLLESANFVHVIEKRQGLLIGDLDGMSRGLDANTL